MSIDGASLVESYVESVSQGFHFHSHDGVLNVITPYLYPDNGGISLCVKELPDGNVEVSDGGETNSYLFMHGFDLSLSQRGRALVEDIASAKVVDFKQGALVKVGPKEELGTLVLDVVHAAIGASHLIYTAPQYKPIGRNLAQQKEDIFRKKLEEFLESKGFSYSGLPNYVGKSGQSYNIHYLFDESIVMHSLSVSRSSLAKQLVDRTYRMWADCNNMLGIRQKITLLNDDQFRWKDSHVNLLRSVSTVVNWSERDKLTELVGSQPTP